MTENQRKLAVKNGTLRKEYEALVNKKIRRRYTLSEELSLHRQKESKPEEFAEMNDYINLCIKEAKDEIYPTNT